MTNLLSLMLPWLARRRRSLLAALLLACCTVAAGVGLLSVAGWFLTAAFLAGAKLAFDLFAPSALVRGLAMVRIALRYAERVTGHGATLGLLADMRTAVFGAIMRLSPAQLAGYRDGDLVARLAGDIDALDTLYLLVIVPALAALALGGAFSLIVGAWLPAAGWLVLAAMLVAACAVPYCLARAAGAAGRHAQQAASAARAFVHEAVQGHADLAAFAAEPQADARFGEAVRGLAHARDAVAAAGSAGQFAQQLIMGLCVVGLLWLGLDAFRAQALDGAVWAGLVLGLLALFEVLGPLMRGAARLGTAAAAGARVRALLREQPAVRDASEVRALPPRGALQASRLGYVYPGAARPVLAGLDLRVEAGERVGIVGASGCGKSTLLALLMRIHDPSEGEIAYGGVPIRLAAQSELHARCALLSQHSPVFLGTLRSNLLLGDPQADDEQLWQALEQARLADFVRTLQHGLDTWVGEAGRLLSMGQARRLCLARAILAPAAVWLLDEPTAGLDEPTQQAFFADLEQAAAGRTVVLATHARLPAGAVDRLLRLEGGRLHS
jgi:ATP-binding cassette subfamily C protein CydC